MNKPPFLIPVENQVRELDAKLLLACFAADQGHVTYIGYKGAIDGYINSFPRGVYFAKSVTERSVKILRIAHLLGHRNVAWDEEAVVHYPPEIYYKRRLSADALCETDQLLAWGEDNKTLFEGYGGFPGTPIKVVGNPRIDLLRPEFQAFYDDDVAAIRAQFGDYILFNTNFGSVNGYYPELNVCYEKADAPDGLELGRSSIGLSRSYALELYEFRRNNFETMKQLVAETARAFPDKTIVVRPHPSENRDVWREHVKDFEHVHVNAEGNVVPWLLGASVLLHNACTTAIESYILGRPAIAFVPRDGADVYGSDLPNIMSHVAGTQEEAVEMIGRAVNGAGLPAQDAGRSKILDEFLTALDGPFAASRIVSSINGQEGLPSPPLRRRALGNFRANGRRLNKWLQTRQDSGRYGRAFKQQRFPDLTPSILQAKAARLCELAGLDTRVTVTELRGDTFKVSPNASR